MASPKRCAFCQRTGQKITNEHAWPDWLRKLFPPVKHTVILARFERPVRQWSPSDTTMGVTVNDVCKDCNNGWMSDMERAIEQQLTPLIVGTVQNRLSPAFQRRIATWCYKTALVFDLITTHADGPYFTSEDRLAFCTTTALPVGGPFVWLGSYSGPNVGTCVDYRFFANTVARSEDGKAEGYISTITIGKVAFQILAGRPIETFSRISIRRSTWDDATFCLWPNDPTADVLWPPKLLMTNEGLSVFIDRFVPKK